MAKFDYIAMNSQGEETAGAVDAASEQEAYGKLRGMGFYPTQVAPEGQLTAKVKASKKASGKNAAKVKGAGGKKGGKVKGKNLMIFTRQLATLIDSGLPLLRGLNVLGNQEPNPNLRATVNTLADSVQTGSTFSESLGQHPRIFNKLYVNMVKAGELGGVLELVLNRLAEYQEKAQKLKNKIVSAMVYPVIVIFIAVAIIIFLMSYIVPKFTQIFKEMLGDAEMPAMTQFVMNVSDFILDYWWALAGGTFLFVVGFKAFASTKGGRTVVDRLKLKLPLFGPVLLKSSIARFTRTLGTLVTSGVPILQALNITRDTAGNVVVSDAILKVHDAVKEGDSMVAPLDSSKIFPPMVISMVEVGEETGQLPEMLLKIADVYDDEVDNAVSALTSLLEPIMICVLAVVVAVIVLALFQPLITIITKFNP